MRILHTADWHLGRMLHGANLIADQHHLLEQFMDLARQEKPDAVLIAGDVYDRAVPPTEAIALLDDVLSRLVLDLKLQVVLIAGNHDGPVRMSFGAQLMGDHGLHIVGAPTAGASMVVLNDRTGPVHVYPLPYAEPAILRNLTQQQDIQGHQAAMKAMVDGIRARHPSGVRSVALAHCFVTGGTGSESERPISIGGAGSIDPAVFQGFNYVALGHLHRPQPCAGGRLWYSGSLMRYSFSETDHQKAVLLVDMDAKGDCAVRKVELVPRRQVRRVEGLLSEVIQGAKEDKAPDDYLMVTLLDQGPVFDAMGKLRAVYPNVLHIERPALTAPVTSEGQRLDHRKMDEMQLFKAFFKQVVGNDLTEQQSAAYAKVVEDLRSSQREGAQ